VLFIYLRKMCVLLMMYAPVVLLLPRLLRYLPTYFHPAVPTIDRLHIPSTTHKIKKKKMPKKG
jgi:hypothetical protein